MRMGEKRMTRVEDYNVSGEIICLIRGSPRKWTYLDHSDSKKECTLLKGKEFHS